jgi:uncharacterized membrane protein
MKKQWNDGLAFGSELKERKQKMRRQTIRKGIGPAVYGAGIGIALIGALVSYTLFLAEAISALGAMVGTTVAAAVGVILVITGVLLQVQREGQEIVGPLLFGAGLFAALIGSLVSHDLYLYRVMSRTGALVGVTVAAALAVLLVDAGVMQRVRYIEAQKSRRVVMKPLHRLRTRSSREDRSGEEVVGDV